MTRAGTMPPAAPPAPPPAPPKKAGAVKAQIDRWGWRYLVFPAVLVGAVSFGTVRSCAGHGVSSKELHAATQQASEDAAAQALRRAFPSTSTTVPYVDWLPDGAWPYPISTDAKNVIGWDGSHLTEAVARDVHAQIVGMQLTVDICQMSITIEATKEDARRRVVLDHLEAGKARLFDCAGRAVPSSTLPTARPS